MAKRHGKLEKVVVDKHISGDALGGLLNRRVLSAETARGPVLQYHGKQKGDEDFDRVLMLAWQEEAALLTADAGMLNKALAFEKRFNSEDSCLRGLIILPVGKSAQVNALRAWMAGETPVIASQKHGPVPRTVAEVEKWNVALDLRQAHVKVVRLCDCEE